MSPYAPAAVLYVRLLEVKHLLYTVKLGLRGEKWGSNKKGKPVERPPVGFIHFVLGSVLHIVVVQSGWFVKFVMLQAFVTSQSYICGNFTCLQGAMTDKRGRHIEKV